MNWKIWLQAFRLRTLPLALSSIAMAGFLAAEKDAFQLPVFLLCISTTICLQILSNLSNDYGDSIHGADHKDRKGPSRAVQIGAISFRAMKKAIIFFVVLSLVSGISLLLVAFGLDWSAILFFLGLGLLSIVAAIGYTVGKKPYGYMGLGDISVLIFFGLVGVLGSLYLFTKSISGLHILPALSCGLFSVGVLNVNNIRDIESDKQAGKHSLPVRLGRPRAVVYHWLLLATGLILGCLYMVFTLESPWQWLFLLSTPFFFFNARAVSNKPSTELDPYLKQMALSTLAFVLLFGAGLLLSH
jgi:1,4-dihydroxy-2-naphthoate polyprenyltransferase